MNGLVKNLVTMGLACAGLAATWASVSLAGPCRDTARRVASRMASSLVSRGRGHMRSL